MLALTPTRPGLAPGPHHQEAPGQARGVWGRLSEVGPISMRAAPDRGRRAESARPGGQTGAARPIVRALSVAVFVATTMSALAAVSASASSSPFVQIAKLCSTPNTTFESVKQQLSASGWKEIEKNQLDTAIAVLGDGFLLSGRQPASREDLAMLREQKRSQIGAFVRRRNSDYFRSKSYELRNTGSFIANIHWNERNERLDCRVVGLTIQDVDQVRTSVLQMTENSASTDLGLVRFTNSFVGETNNRTTLFELNSSVLNSELDQPLLANFGLNVISRR